VVRERLLTWVVFGVVDAVALIVQIHLQQNRNDLAVKEVAAARRWAQDSLLVNLAESWVGLRLVGRRRIIDLPVYGSLTMWVSTGRRKVPTSVLRLRRAGTSARDIVSTDAGLTSSC